MHVCQLPWTKSIHHQEPVPFALNLKIVGPTQSCQNIHKDWPTWSTQLGALSRRWWMENDIQNLLQPFWICCDALWIYQCTCCLSTYYEWCLSWIFGWFCGLLHWWHLHFLKKHGRPSKPCTSCFGKASKSWSLCQIGKVWIPSIWGRILGLYYF